LQIVYHDKLYNCAKTWSFRVEIYEICVQRKDENISCLLCL